MIELLTHVKVITMLLVYLLGGKVEVEQKVFADPTECRIAVAKRVQEIQKDPRFQGGFGAWCFETPGEHS